jgi:hypothetical protein
LPGGASQIVQVTKALAAIPLDNVALSGREEHSVTAADTTDFDTELVG